MKNKLPILCCSYPKSGRSWLRFILANYINEVYSLNLTINFNNLFSVLPNNGPDPRRGIPAYKYQNDAQIPFILFDHSLYHKQYANVPILFVIRNIEDTLVSNFFQDRYRIGCFNGTIKEYIRSENGIKRVIQYMNSWSCGLQECNHEVVSYEMLHNSIEESLGNIISNILKINVNYPALKNAIELSRFEKMKKIEIETGFPNSNIKIDVSDNKSLRAREGKVGAYDKHLDDQDLIFLTEQKSIFMSTSSSLLVEKYCS